MSIARNSTSVLRHWRGSVRVPPGDVYDTGFRIKSIERGATIVNSVTTPTGSWVYTLTNSE